MLCRKLCQQRTLCEIPKHIQVYFLLKFVEQDNGKTSDLEKDDFQLHSTPV